MPSHSPEDYLKTIDTLEQREISVTSLSIARPLDIPQAMVVNTLPHLINHEYVLHHPLRGVTLTNSGSKKVQETVPPPLSTSLPDASPSSSHKNRRHSELSPSDFQPPERSSLVPLNHLRKGEVGVIVEIRGGRRLRTRVCDLGLTPHTRVQVVKTAPFHGPVEVAVRGTHLALGRHVAHKILVQRIQEASSDTAN